MKRIFAILLTASLLVGMLVTAAVPVGANGIGPSWVLAQEFDVSSQAVDPGEATLSSALLGSICVAKRPAIP